MSNLSSFQRVRMHDQHSMSSTYHQPLLQFQGSKHLAQRLITSTLTGKPIRVSHLRSSLGKNTGLASHEISLLRLLEAITNGSKIEFSHSGTTLIYRPGLIVGSLSGYGAEGCVVKHEIPVDCSRGVSYFIYALCLLSFFSKGPINVLFTGPGVITSATKYGDPSADTLRIALLPLLNHFSISSDREIRILRRSSPDSKGSGGTGEVQVILGHHLQVFKTLHLISLGKIKKIRGVAYSSGMPGSINARMIESARGILNHTASDIYIFSDCASVSTGRDQTGSSSRIRKIGLGFGLSLVAESTTTCYYSADVASLPNMEQSPEELGRHCVYQLLETITEGGCVPLTTIPTVLIMMAMGSSDISRLRVAKNVAAHDNFIQLARDLQVFGAGEWMIEDSLKQSRDLVIGTLGCGVGNINRGLA